MLYTLSWEPSSTEKATILQNPEGHRLLQHQSSDVRRKQIQYGLTWVIKSDVPFVALCWCTNMFLQQLQAEDTKQQTALCQPWRKMGAEGHTICTRVSYCRSMAQPLNCCQQHASTTRHKVTVLWSKWVNVFLILSFRKPWRKHQVSDGYDISTAYLSRVVLKSCHLCILGVYKYILVEKNDKGKCTQDFEAAFFFILWP